MKVFSTFDTEQQYAIGYGCMSTDNASELIRLMDIGDFIDVKYKKIFEAINSAMCAFTEVSPATVAQYLAEDDGDNLLLESYIKNYKENCVDSIEAISRLLKDRRVRHLVGILGSKMETEAYLDTTSGIELVHRLSNAVDMLKQKSGLASLTPTSTKEVLDKAEILKNNILEGKQAGITTGIHTLDSKLAWGGYSFGEFTAIGALRSVGKTALSLQGFYNAGLQGIPAVYITLEMPEEKLFYRMSLRYTHGLRPTPENIADEVYMENIKLFSKWFREKKLYIESKYIKLNDILVYVKNVARNFGVRAVFIDYGNKIKHPDSRMVKYEQLTEIARDLKYLAVSENLAMVVNYQLTQGLEDGREPHLGNFKESGGTADEADTVIFLWGDRQKDEINCRVAKQRDFKISKPFRVLFDRSKQTMQNGIVVSDKVF